MPYLGLQHKKFCTFISSAKEKYELFKRILKNIRESQNVAKFINENPQNIHKVIISYNNFYVSDLSGVINFHDELSIAGIERETKNDMLSIQSVVSGKKKIRICRDFSSKDDNKININYNKIIKYVELVLGINKKGENS